jgi:hypothetical protein
MESAAAASRRVRRRWVAAAPAWGEGGGVGCLGRRQRGPQRLGLLREDRGRREMKFLVLRLLKENNSSCISSSSDSCAETLHILSELLGVFVGEVSTGICQRFCGAILRHQRASFPTNCSRSR